MLNDNALTTLAKVKSYLAITDTSQDALLEEMINSASRWIEQQCGDRRFVETTYTGELYDGNGSPDIFLRNFPVTDFTEITLDGTALDASAYVVDLSIGRVHLKSGVFQTGVQNYAVTYDAGFATIPSDLDFLCQLVVATAYNETQSSGVQSESLGAYSVTYIQETAGADESILKTLANYKKYL